MARRGWAGLAVVLILAGVFSRPTEAGRPFLSASDAAVVDPGAVEVEVGIQISRNTRDDNDETTYLLPSAVFNIGIADRLEIDISTGFELVDDDKEGETLGSATNTSFILKTLWWEGEDGAPSIATEVGLSFPTARKEFQPNEEKVVGWGGRVDVSGELGRLVYILNLGGGVGPSPGVQTSPGDDERASVFLWAVAGELSVADRVAVVSEFQGKVIQDADDEATALLGLTYTTLGGVKFDIAGFAGLADGSDNWGITFGLTFGFPIVSRTAGEGK